MITCAEFWTDERLVILKNMVDTTMRASGIKGGMPSAKLWTEVVESIEAGKVGELGVEQSPDQPSRDA